MRIGPHGIIQATVPLPPELEVNRIFATEKFQNGAQASQVDYDKIRIAEVWQICMKDAGKMLEFNQTKLNFWQNVRTKRLWSDGLAT